MRTSGWTYAALRLAAMLALVGFLGMINWSLDLIEERLITVETGVDRLTSELRGLKREVRKLLPNPLSSKGENGEGISPVGEGVCVENPLIADPYFNQTLPSILGSEFRPHGTLRMATLGRPEELQPFSQWAQVAEWTQLCQGALANLQFGRYDQLVQDMALSIVQKESAQEGLAEFHVELRPGLLWQPLDEQHFSPDVQLAPHFLTKHPLTAADFKFYWEVVVNPNVDLPGAIAVRHTLADIHSIEIRDDLHFIVHWKKRKRSCGGEERWDLPYAAMRWVAALRPLPAFVYQYLPNGKKMCPDDDAPDFYRKNSIFAQQFCRHFASRVIVSCGPWIFDGMTDSAISFRRNPDYHTPTQALFERIVATFFDTPDAMWRDFQAEALDACTLIPSQLALLGQFEKSTYATQQKKRGKEIVRFNYPLRAFSYVGWNMHSPLFADRQVRLALTMAIDRQRLIAQNLAGQGLEVTGPFFYSSPSYDKSLPPIPYDPDAARHLLNLAGWYDSDGDGVVDKRFEGVSIPFRFALTYYVKNPVTKANAELISTQLKEIGVDCVPYGVDLPDLSQAFDTKSFQALLLAWALDTPPEDPDLLWNSRGANQEGSCNAVGYASKTADALIEALTFEQNVQTRQSLYHKFHDLIAHDAPYTFLYCPRMTVVIWSNLKGVFIPKDHPELIPGATVEEPSLVNGWF